MKNYIELEKEKIYGIRMSRGILRINVSKDNFFPGLDIEFISDEENQNKMSRPRILIEAPINEYNGDQEDLRALIWNNQDSEDYSEEIILKKFK